MIMKSIIISSNSSGGGKTTVTLGLMKALINRGHSVQGYKVGPDYIDPAFHSRITGKASRNLDIYLMGEQGIKASYSRGQGDLGIIEGVMGLYDGKGITTEYSTAHVAKLLKLPVVLVLSPKAQSATLCAEINGLCDFEDINIAGVILNNISESYYRLLKAAIEKNCAVEVFGYIPKDESLSLKSRHLGLVQSSEIDDLESKIQHCSSLIERYVDLDGLIKAFKGCEDFEDPFHLENRGIRTAVALDKAFSFYYRENLELLGELGEVVYFSPLKDKALPENIDFLYIGGGYPEVFVEELGGNTSMLNSIKSALEGGLRCYAECGGLMYLTGSIEGISTVAFFSGKSEMSGRLQNFGYANISISEENPLLPKGFTINCHEFHKSRVELEEQNIYRVYKDMYDCSQKSWTCGYVKNNTLAGYAHVHFFGNLEFLKRLCRKD
jgi:cobyrinic acid a,c-diamide synthase